MNKKLRKLLKSQKAWGGVMLDTYNQKVITDISCTTTTRVNASNEIYVVENYEEDKVENGNVAAECKV